MVVFNKASRWAGVASAPTELPRQPADRKAFAAFQPKARTAEGTCGLVPKVSARPQHTINTRRMPSIMINANPAYPLVIAQRIALGGEFPEFGVVDFWGNLAIAAAWAFGFLVIGFTSFVANKHKHADIV